jgi:hypothetical protein
MIEEKIDKWLLVDNMVIQMLGSRELAKTWWNSDNYHFGLKTPNEAWEENPEKVISYVCSFSNGDFS